MKTLVFLCFSTILFLFAGSNLFAESSIDGEIRTKFELRDGYKTLVYDSLVPAFVISQRSRLNLSFKNDVFSSGFSLQDVRSWGETPFKTDMPNFNIHEAWGGVKLHENVELKIGRQVLNYDKKRLLGTKNWNDVGASHDVALLKIANKISHAHIGLAYNNDDIKSTTMEYYTQNYYRYLGFIHGMYDLGNGMNVTALGMMEGRQNPVAPESLYNRLTFGANFEMANDSLPYGFYGSFYYQGGQDVSGMSVAAIMFSLNVMYDVTSEFFSQLSVDYFSGNDYSETVDKNKAFDNTYGNGHLYYGYMDYFTSVANNTGGAGLMDVYYRANYNVAKKVNTEFTYHYFATTGQLLDMNGDNADKYLGSEVDIVALLKPVKGFSAKIGYSFMLASDTMELLKSGDSGHFNQWFWIMTTFKPNFFKSE